MFSIITGSVILSVLHALIPNHWLPIIAIGKKEKWSLREVINITLLCALAHGLSTIILGIALGYLGATMAETVEHFTHYVAPAILIILGCVFIYRHHTHKHFQIDNSDIKKKKSKGKIVFALTAAMFLSPCMEIEAYFFLAGAHEKWLIYFIAALYLIITTIGMLTLVRLAWIGLLKLNWHRLEHNAGIITGITLVITGIIAFFIH